jgi:probable addiction module antidote protein
MALKTTKFDPADYLATAEARAAYLTEALATNDAAFIADAVGVVARAKGMSAVARNAKLSRESLYKSLKARGNPEFDTIIRVVEALGLKLTAAPLVTKKGRRASVKTRHSPVQTRRRKAA